MPDRLTGLRSRQQGKARGGRVVAGYGLGSIHGKSNGGRGQQDTTKPATRSGGGPFVLPRRRLGRAIPDP